MAEQHKRVQISFDRKKCRVQKHMAKDCDINVIIARAQKTGVLDSPGTRRKEMVYGDFSYVPDYCEAQNKVLEVQENFMALPSKVRERFGNDPVKIMAFLGDEKNRDEAISLGLVKRPPEKPVVPVSDKDHGVNAPNVAPPASAPAAPAGGQPSGAASA